MLLHTRQSSTQNNKLYQASLYNLVNKNNLVHKFIISTFINFYMFRSIMCPSSGEITAYLRHLVQHVILALLFYFFFFFVFFLIFFFLFVFFFLLFCASFYFLVFFLLVLLVIPLLLLLLLLLLLFLFFFFLFFFFLFFFLDGTTVQFGP